MEDLVLSPLNALLYGAIAISFVALFNTVWSWKELSPPLRTVILWVIALVALMFVFVLNRAKWI